MKILDETVGLSLSVNRETVARLLLTPEAKLDILAQNELARVSSLRRLAFLVSFLAFIEQKEPRRRFRLFGLSNIVKRYIDLKNRALALPGRRIAQFVKSRRRDGGRGLCIKIDYCRRKTWINERLGLLEQIGPEQQVAAEGAAKLIEETIPEGQEFLELVMEFVGEAIDFFGGLIPLPLIVKMFKYGLDELCPCCRACDGTGAANGAPCVACAGTGLLTVS